MRKDPPRYQIPFGGAIRRYHPPLVLSQISRGFYVRDDEAKSYSANGEPPAGLSEAENGVWHDFASNYDHLVRGQRDAFGYRRMPEAGRATGTARVHVTAQGTPGVRTTMTGTNEAGSVSRNADID